MLSGTENILIQNGKTKMSYIRTRYTKKRASSNAGAFIPNEPKVSTPYRYNSLEEFLQVIDASKVYPWASSVSIRSNNNEFYGHLSYYDARKLVTSGCPDTSARMREMYNDVHASASKIFKPDMQFADAGLFFDVATFLEGTPEYWLDEQVTEQDARGSKGVVRIYANVASAYHVTPEQYLKRGANIAQAVEMLELSGYSTEVIACAGNYTDNKSHDCYITIKAPDQMLDFDKLAFVVGHCAFYRRLYFRWLESRPAEIRTLLNVTAHGGYGHISDCPDKDGISLTTASYSMQASDWKKILSEYITFEDVQNG